MSKKIVVTGVTRGLGRALAEGFVKRGNQVFGCGRSKRDLINLARQFPEHIFDRVDVSDFREVGDWAEDVISQFGPPDLLINNAAVINPSLPLWELDVEAVKKLFDTNIQGVFHCIRAFVPAMVQRQSGIIVNLSSGWGRGTSPHVAPYCASKWAMEGLSKSMAQELPTGMACVPLNPGIIDTDMLRSCFGSQASHYPDAEAWAERAVPYLLSLTPRHNGQSLSVPQ